MPTASRKSKAPRSTTPPQTPPSPSVVELSTKQSSPPGTIQERVPEVSKDNQSHNNDGPGRSKTPGELPSIEMELALAPPAQVVTGSQFRTPLVVTFKSSNTQTMEQDSKSQHHDFSGIWAYLSLMNENMSTSLVPPQQGLLMGQPVAAVQPLPMNVDVDATIFAYAKFPGIAITAPGRFCFKINVIDMQSHDAEGGVDNPTTARVLPAIHTAAFDVIDAVEPTVCAVQDPDEERNIARLTSMGIDV